MGVHGEPGCAAAAIESWQVDRARYVATPILADGREGPALELRPLFEQFLQERTEAGDVA